MSDSNFFQDAVDKGKNLLSKINSIGNNPWPQTRSNNDLGLLGSKTPGFLPPVLIPAGNPTWPIGGDGTVEVSTKYSPYIYTDWRGHNIFPGVINATSKTEERFNLSLTLPSINLEKDPYSTRDNYLLFNDSSTDYFKHGLQVINNLNSDFPTSSDSKGRLSGFESTPYELNDPVMFGFEIIIDAASSPLLNGAVLDFINNYGPKISEVNARKPIYEEFKQQFSKIFKTNFHLTNGKPDGKDAISIDNTQTKMTGTNTTFASSESNKNIFFPGKKAYMSYYLKKIGGLDNLVEKNTSSAFNYLVDYRKDVIRIDFIEDVSLTVGTLAHLYKLLYWSKANGKGIIPENLLRFNCEIIVSECRNFNRVRKAVGTNNLEVLKDNVSRHVYSLRECQFYFDSMPHPADIDMSGPVIQENYSISFDYKYVTSKLEKWNEGSDRFGKYVGYNNGALWKIGNPGERENRGTQSGGTIKDSSFPKFFTVGTNTFNQNGVSKPTIMNDFWAGSQKEDVSFKNKSNDPTDQVDEQESNNSKAKSKLKEFGKASEKKGKDLAKKLSNKLVASATRELQTQINSRVAILNKSLNKILNASGVTGMKPPTNVYSQSPLNSAQRIFYDVRGELFNFVGDSLGDAIGGGSGRNRSF